METRSRWTSEDVVRIYTKLRHDFSGYATRDPSRISWWTCPVRWTVVPTLRWIAASGFSLALLFAVAPAALSAPLHSGLASTVIPNAAKPGWSPSGIEPGCWVRVVSGGTRVEATCADGRSASTVLTRGTRTSGIEAPSVTPSESVRVTIPSIPGLNAPIPVRAHG